MPQIIVCEWRVIFSENLLHKTVYPVKDPWVLGALVELNIQKNSQEGTIDTSCWNVNENNTNIIYFHAWNSKQTGLEYALLNM